MELTTRFGGLGIVSLTEKEKNALERIVTIARGNGILFVLAGEEELKAGYKALCEEIFPSLSLSLGPRSYNKCWSAHSSKTPLLKENNKEYYETIRISLERYHRDPKLIYRPSFSIKPELQLFLEKDGEIRSEHPMALYVMNYDKDCIDDLVDLLGERENPTIKSPQVIPYSYNIDYKERFIGFAEIPFFKKITQLYERAEYLVSNAQGIIDISHKELTKLREDKETHTNTFVKRGSKQLYEESLRTLSKY